MPSVTLRPPPDAAASQFGPVLERVRKRLLDLSANNALLNYRHPRASSLRVYDEVSAQVFERLCDNARFTFAPLSDPPTQLPLGGAGGARDAAELAPAAPTDPRALARAERRASQARREARRLARAAELGIPTDPDLPAAAGGTAPNHRDTKLQTLLFPDELEDRLRALARTATTVLEETGANRLHLLFGFVEWTDAGAATDATAAGTPRLAPLVLVPVALERRDVDPATNTFRYGLRRTGEDWSANVTLQEKCRADFGLELPGVEDDESLEHYFQRVERVLRAARPAWRLRRYVTLGLVSFGKVLMWRDLDPGTWPRERPILASAPLRRLLGAAPTEGIEDVAARAGRAAEYPLDRMDEGPGAVPPVVIEADSSQHSALVDVERGVDLVLQGPPGTGKSQTITNLIAAAMKHGRRVLFVAEKKAALDVVHARLQGAGLGDFCLALHSHSSAKREFVAELAQRLALRDDPPGPPRELAALTDRLVRTREQLGRPLEALHAPFGAVERTPYEIFWRARRLAAAMPDAVLDTVQELRLPEVTRATAQQVADRRDRADDFAGAYEKVRADGLSLERHHWAGVTRDDIANDSVADLLDAAHAWRAALAALVGEAETLGEVGGAPADPSPETLAAFARAAAALPALPPDVPDALPHALFTRTSLPDVRAAVDAVADAGAAWRAVGGRWSAPGALPRADAAGVAEVLRRAVARFPRGRTLRAAAHAGGTARTLRARLAAAERAAADLREVVGDDGRALTLAAVGVGTAAVNRARALDPASRALLHTATAQDGAGVQLDGLEARAAVLRAERDQLDGQFPPSFRPDAEVLRATATALATAPRFLPWLLSGPYRRAVTQYRALSAGRVADRAAMLSDLQALVRHADAAVAFAHDPALAALFGAAAAGVESPFAAARAAVRWHAELTTLAAPLGVEGRTLARRLRDATSDQWVELRERAVAHEADWRAAESLGALGEEATVATDVAAESWQARPLADLAEALEATAADAEALDKVASAAGAGPEHTVDDLARTFARVQAAWRADDAVAERADVLRRLDVAPHGSQTAVAPLEGALRYVDQVAAAGLPAATCEWLLAADARARRDRLQAHATRVGEAVRRAADAARPLVDGAGLDPAGWAGAVPGGPAIASGATIDAVPVAHLQRRLDHAIDRERALYPWAVYRRTRAGAVREGLGDVVALVEAERLGGTAAGAVYEAAFYRNLAAAVLRERPVLDDFDSGVHGEVRARFAKVDAEREELMRQEIAAELARAPGVPGCPGPLVRDMTGERLIAHQAGLQRRHLAIRELFKRAGGAIQALKPCFLMGPQAVAQFLPPGAFEFDLVVMDEASQMRPEDALGAIARGRQVLIVGDPMQLGPTRFFDRQDGDGDGDGDGLTSDDGAADDGEEDVADDAADEAPPEPPLAGPTVLERSESILLAAAAQFPVRMLRWHYRSRHERLIAFSNREFYGGRLIVFPSPAGAHAEDGVRLHRVAGAYAGQVNVPEARAVVDAVRAHARDYPDRSLLVATLNAKQADLVDRLVEEAEKDDPVLGDFRARHAGTREPFAVKNLENVQGDERDRIFVSVTFGPDAATGQLYQRFGPLSQAGGERRLNVLFTRAKHRLDVFCSFDPSALRVNEATSPRGLRVLRDYLRYANGELWWAAGAESGRAPDSDFEVAVAEALGARGYAVKAQVGVAGYFLDLAVVDPDLPGRFLLGVECDGATYHSAKTARDRDRLRQKQLESLGWTLHRIWSTDWFKDPTGQLNRVVARIEALRAARHAASVTA